MVFSSITFLSVFFPVVFLFYAIIPGMKARNILLMLASLVFYAYGEPVYVLLMIGSTFVNYVFALRIQHGKDAEKPLAAKNFLRLAVLVNLGILCVFKYADMLINSLNAVLSLHVPCPNITLPIGVSFFTFQAMSYVFDVYRGDVRAQRSFIYVQLYIAFFPQLIAGPIVRYRDIENEIGNREWNVAQIAGGLRRFLLGLGKKVLIANTMGQVVDAVFLARSGELNFLGAWIGALAYLFQIYYDFSGYSDMAIGMGQIFGFHFKENFNYPYGARNIQDFWRRWHISLSTWFREYLYIPLGGNRRGNVRTVCNKLIVFFCTGLWHGANWTFVVWGLYHGLFLFLEQAFPKIRRLPSWAARFYTILVVCVGFVVFRAESLAQGFFMLGKMFGGFTFSAPEISFALQQLTPWFLAMLAAAVVGCAPLQRLKRRFAVLIAAGHSETEDPPYPIRKASQPGRTLESLSYVLSFTILLLCVLRLSGSAYNPFIYFRF